jgi:ADP-ribose pyrophosphatase
MAECEFLELGVAGRLHRPFRSSGLFKEVAVNLNPYPSLGAGVVLFDDDGRVLLVHQNYGHHRWTLPGGMFETGESPVDAALREVLEEVGVRVELGELIGAYYVRRAKPGIRFVFRARIADDAAPALSDDELDEIGWFEPNDLPDPMTPALPYAVADAIAGRSGMCRSIDVGT